jgi:hypothetical protein
MLEPSTTVKLDPGRPVELTDLTESFAALARFYGRHYRPEGHPAPPLYVTRLESGSVIAEIVPYTVILGAIVSMMDSSIIVADFYAPALYRHQGIRRPPGLSKERLQETFPTLENGADIREFIKPLAGKRGATLAIKQARFEKTDEEKSIVLEYKFDEAEINRAMINIDEALSRGDDLALQAELPGATESIKGGDALF